MYGTGIKSNPKTITGDGVAEPQSSSHQESLVPSPHASSFYITMNNGFIVVWRKMADTSFYKDSYALHLAIHCLLKANHKETKTIFNKKEIVLKRGQFISGRFSLAADTGIKPSTIREKLSLLKNIGFLDIKPTNKFSLITIVKYSDYQGKKEKNDSSLDNKMTTKCQQNDTDNNVNNKTMEQEEPKSPFTFPFEEVYKRYPNKKGKKAALAHFNASVKTEQDWLNINKALDNYLKSETVKKGFVRNASTWFNDWEASLYEEHQPKVKYD
jgi:hypothetical protein